MEKYRKDPLRPIIGQGNYGVVYRVRDVSNGQEYALKCHKCADVIEDTTVRELSCLTALRGHPNIILLLDCFMDEDRVAMLMPYVPFELTKAIHCKPTAPLSFVASFSLQTANALEYMHRQGILHRDLTPSNVLLTADLTVKVGDLGLARQFSKRMSLCVVTEPYRAPELFADGEVGEYTCAVDMWSLGAIILDAKEGMVVFAGTQQYNTLNKVMALASTDLSEEAEELKISRREMIPNTMRCESTKRIAFRLIVLGHQKRLTARELLDDEEWKGLACMTDQERTAVLRQCIGDTK
ncbi:cell division control protein 2 homolog 3-like [Oryzias melastigma]|uniref:cell division control protein 2 homolog 3-like n=1 Tax=Oryzias melastigma TaxID=30732 RepID=UPI00168CFD7C|nr:cell division control protein 2 homolog 3-like [Oryzias melastigma]